MRILMSNIAAVARAGPAATWVRGVLVPVTRRNGARVAAPGTQFVFRFSERGQAHPAFGEFRHLPLVAPQAMVGMARQAERDGFDAVILACFGDPMLAECRAAIDLPVTGFGEASMLLAAAMGGKFGIVSPSPALVEPIRRQVERLGLVARLAGVCATREPARDQEHGLVDARATIAHFQAAARELVEQGAEAIIPGCGLLSPALRLAPGAADEWPAGCTHVDGVPVVDIVAAAVLAAEGLARLRSAGNAVRARPARAVDECSEEPCWDCP